MPAPKALLWALNEHILGANPAVWMYAGGSAFAQIFAHNGTEEQKKWAVIAAERDWGATMVLTEPDAGSDVGAGRTKAVKQEDGSWHIDGVKRFITSAEADDMFENIFHLVLARPEGAGPGTKGLSLFFVPKFHFDFETGELGERNGVYVTNVEHKMGLKVSATCELTFGQHDKPAVGWLVRHRWNRILASLLVSFATVAVLVAVVVAVAWPVVLQSGNFIHALPRIVDSVFRSGGSVPVNISTNPASGVGTNNTGSNSAAGSGTGYLQHFNADRECTFV